MIDCTKDNWGSLKQKDYHLGRLGNNYPVPATLVNAMYANNHDWRELSWIAQSWARDNGH